MKKIVSFSSCFLLLLAGFSLSAQQKVQKETKAEQTSIEKPQLMGLDLSPQQMEQLAEIRKTIILDRDALKKSSGENKEDAVKQVEEHQQKIFEAFKEILTEEQLEQYHKNLNAMEELKVLKRNEKKESNQK